MEDPEGEMLVCVGLSECVCVCVLGSQNLCVCVCGLRRIMYELVCVCFESMCKYVCVLEDCVSMCVFWKNV